MALFSRSWVATALLAVPMAAAASGSPDRLGADVLERALANRFDVDLAQRVELVLRNHHGAERRYGVELAAKRIDGQLRSFARFTDPPSESGTSILMIEQRDRSDDTFVYFPYAQRVRRVSSAQRADRFMGTDLTYEDFERRYVDDYEIVGTVRSELLGEPIYRIRVRPKFSAAYGIAQFSIAANDYAILEIRYFKDVASEGASRVFVAPRANMIRRGGHVLPTRVTIQDHHRHTTTEVHFVEIEVNPPLDDSLFSSVSMQLRKTILTGEGSASVD